PIRSSIRVSPCSCLNQFRLPHGRSPPPHRQRGVHRLRDELQRAGFQVDHAAGPRPLPPNPTRRWRPTASISSTQTMQGLVFFASTNRSRTRPAPTPTKSSTNSDPEALAVTVLTLAGGSGGLRRDRDRVAVDDGIHRIGTVVAATAVEWVE